MAHVTRELELELRICRAERIGFATWRSVRWFPRERKPWGRGRAKRQLLIVRNVERTASPQARIRRHLGAGSYQHVDGSVAIWESEVRMVQCKASKAH